ncbi:MAG: carbon-nitrogen hydrolase family protein [Aggregatilineales bacterium]
MKIGVVQIESLNGDIDGNIARHAHFVRLAAEQNVELLVFPELSLTQYDAPNAKDMATIASDPRFDELQAVADETRVTFCAGVPLKAEDGNTISMLIFQPEKAMMVYTKHYLHADEEPFFVAGMADSGLVTVADEVAFAVCYEISVAQHAQDAHERGASLYVASVAKTASGVANAHERLKSISRDYGMTVFLSNCIGPADGSIGGGRSAIWNAAGEIIAEMDDAQEGFIVYDPQLSHLPAEVVPVTLIRS